LTTENDMPVDKCILHILQHMGIKQAHFATGSMGDLTGLVSQHAELFAILTLVCSGLSHGEIVGSLAPRLLVFRGDTRDWDGLAQIVNSLAGATLETLRDWAPWSDLVALHTVTIRSAMFPFLTAHYPADSPQMAPADDERGAFAGIS